MLAYITRTFSAVALLACLIVSPVPSQSSSQESVALTSGDAVKITVWRRPELTGEFTIAADGSINHPLYRSVIVAGLPFATVEERLRKFLETLETNPQFVVQPLLRVSVGGEVRQPSLYRFPPETSIAEAVALAGGVSERGRLDRVKLMRSDGTVLRVDLTQPDESVAQQPINSGDQIFVERRISFFREYIAPAGSIMAALVSLANLLTR
jgi:protein involved in polysaccharide export with SLBB domain